MKKLAPILLSISVLLLVLLPSTQAANNFRATAAEGLVKVDGQDAVVTIWVDTTGVENPRAAAQAALNRAYPEARPVPAHFEASGNTWDVFSDSDPGNDFVTVRYNGSDAPSNIASLDHYGVFAASMQTWTDVASSKFVFEDGGTTGKCPSLVRECKGRQTFDGNNDVAWLNISEPNVLGVTWSGVSTDEFDMAIDNTDFDWHMGDPSSIGPGQIDLQTVEIHEFGHGLGLGHSQVAGSVMEAVYAGPRRVLHQDDVDGVTFLYPNGGAPEPTPDPVPGETMTISSIEYVTEGGRFSDKHLNTTISILDENGSPVEGANIAVTLTNSSTNQSWVGSGQTGVNGTVGFTLKNAPGGTYSTSVDSLEASGLSWDGTTPVNSFTK